MKRIIIGIAGGTGSGKTTVAKKISQHFKSKVIVIQHDSYYKDCSHLSAKERKKVNFDHPWALETNLLVKHLKQLSGGETIKKPMYCFKTHKRRTIQIIKPRPIIVVEGILIFTHPELRRLMDIKIFVDTDADIRFIRRLKRDIKERGRNPDSVIGQYLNTVRPMHSKFVEPAKRYADMIISGNKRESKILKILIAKTKSLLTDKQN